MSSQGEGRRDVDELLGHAVARVAKNAEVFGRDGVDARIIERYLAYCEENHIAPHPDVGLFANAGLGENEVDVPAAIMSQGAVWRVGVRIECKERAKGMRIPFFRLLEMWAIGVTVRRRLAGRILSEVVRHIQSSVPDMHIGIEDSAKAGVAEVVEVGGRWLALGQRQFVVLVTNTGDDEWEDELAQQLANAFDALAEWTAERGVTLEVEGIVVAG